MRLAILDKGHSVGAKLMFGMIRLFSGQRVVDAVKLVMYRPEFYGNPMKRVTHEAMRGSLFLVGRRSRADGGIRVEGQRNGVLHQGPIRRGRKGLSGRRARLRDAR
jgi:hypothetical protein